MGTFHVQLAIADALGERWEDVCALVNTDSLHTWIASGTLERLGIAPTYKQRFRTADGQLVEYGMAEAKVRLNGRVMHTLVVFGEPGRVPLLGRLTLDGFGLGVDGATKRLIEVPALA